MKEREWGDRLRGEGGEREKEIVTNVNTVEQSSADGIVALADYNISFNKLKLGQKLAGNYVTPLTAKENLVHDIARCLLT